MYRSPFGGTFLAGFGHVALGGCAPGEEVVELQGEADPTGSVRVPLGRALWERAGAQFGGAFGSAVAGAGDVNGDGYGDVVIGAPGLWEGEVGEEAEGHAYVYLGSPAGPSSSADWNGQSDALLAAYGAAVAGAGDVNGDGYDDLLIGAPQTSTGAAFRAGAAHVYLGGASGLAERADWSVYGEEDREDLGRSVAGVGDVDGDGYDDVLVGAPGYPAGSEASGRALLYLGGPDGLAAEPAWTFEGSGRCCADLAAAGDVNADGYADFLVGVRYHGSRVYAFLGGTGGPADTPDAEYDSASQSSDVPGTMIAPAGDADGDGHDDILIHSFQGMGLGQDEVVALYRGNRAGLGSSPKWETVLHEWRWSPERHFTGVAGNGDLNGDGHDDLALGKARESAWISVSLGSADGYAREPAWREPASQGEEGFGESLAIVGDVNGDGLDDLLVGAPAFGEDQGRAVLYPGHRTGPPWRTGSVVGSVGWIS